VTVCLRVTGFNIYAYLEPFRRFLETEQEASDWILGLPDAPPGCKFSLVKMGRLCGAVEESWFVRLQGKSPLRYTVKEHFESCARVYHHDQDPILAFLHSTGVRCWDFVHVNEAIKEEARIRRSRCDVEFMIPHTGLSPPDAQGGLIDLTVASFDLETDGLDPSKDEIRMVSIYWTTYPWKEIDDDKGRTLIICRHDMTMDPAPDYEVEIVPSERSLIEKLVDVLVQHRPVFLTGWNISGFDVRFMYKRAEVLKCATGPRGVFNRLSLLKKAVEGKEKQLSTAAFGHNDLFVLNVLGLHVVDGMLLARKGKAQLKIANVKLDTFAKRIGKAKGDVKYEDMVKAFTTRDPDLIRNVADYCALASCLRS
jgi:DNA polymerase elongation subunit (family B)